MMQQLTIFDDIVGQTKQLYGRFRRRYTYTYNVMLAYLNCIVCKTTLINLGIDENLQRQQLERCDDMVVSTYIFLEEEEIEFLNSCQDALDQYINITTSNQNHSFSNILDFNDVESADIWWKGYIYEKDYDDLFYCLECTTRHAFISQLDAAISSQRMLEYSFQKIKFSLNVALLVMKEIEPLLSSYILSFEENNITKLQLGETILRSFDRHRMKIRSEISNIISGTYEMRWYAEQLEGNLNSVYQNKMVTKFPVSRVLILTSDHLFQMQ